MIDARALPHIYDRSANYLPYHHLLLHLRSNPIQSRLHSISMGRAPCCEKVGLNRGKWTAEEDRLLRDYVAANGEGSWRSLPKNAGLLRCGKSCRLRWVNYLRADVKRGNISEEEEQTILRLQASLGNRWSVIASHLPGRTDNEIKNYWISHLSKKARMGSSAAPPTSCTKHKRKPRTINPHGEATDPAKRKKKTKYQSNELHIIKNEGDPKKTMITSSMNARSDDDGRERDQPEEPQREDKGCVWNDLLDGMLKELEATQAVEGAALSSSCTTEKESRKEAGDEGEGSWGGLASAVEGLGDIPWEEDCDMWKWLWDGENELCELDDLEKWLLSDIF